MRAPMRGHELHADLGVVAWVPLADVVEERAEHEQVGPVRAGHEGRGVGARLHEVPIDREAVVRVALRLAPHRLPLGEDVDPEPHLVERLDDGDGAVSGEEQVDQRSAHVVGPGRRQGSGRGGQPVERAAVDPRVPSRGGRGGPEHQARVGGGIGLGGEVDLAVTQSEAGPDRAVAPWRAIRRVRGAMRRSAARRRRCARRSCGRRRPGCA